MSEEKTNGLRPLQFRDTKELSDFLEMMGTMNVVDISYVSAPGKLDRAVGFYYGVHDDVLHLASHQNVGQHEEPFIEIPVKSIRAVTSYYAGTPYEVPQKSKVPPRRKGRINLKGEFL